MSLSQLFKKENGVNYINENDCLRIVNKITKKENTPQNKVYNSKEIPNESITKIKNLEDGNLNSSDTLKTKVNERWQITPKMRFLIAETKIFPE